MMGIRRARSVLCCAVGLLATAVAIAQSSLPEFTTDDQQAILDADLTGWWAVIDRTDPRGSTAGYFSVRPDGTTVLTNPSCGVLATPSWEYEDGVMTFTFPGEGEVEMVVLAVPTGWRGTLVIEDSNNWKFLSPDPYGPC